MQPLDSAQFIEDSLRGLAEFSHVEIVYVFDHVDPGSFELGARRPSSNHVLDIKPYMSEFAPRGPVRQPSWSRELMRGYW